MKQNQEKLFTEPEEPDQALDFAMAFEERVKRQKAYGTHLAETPTRRERFKSALYLRLKKRKTFFIGKTFFDL